MIDSAAPISARLPSALYADLFYTNPGAAEFRRDHLAVWILVELATKGERTLDQLSSEFESAYPGCTLEFEGLDSALSALQGDAKIQLTASGLYQVTEGGQRDVTQAKARFANSRQAFFDQVGSRIEEVTSSKLLESETEAIQHCTEGLIIRCLLEEKDSLDQLYKNPDDFGSLPAKARERSADLDNCLNRELPESLATRKIDLRREVLASVSRHQTAGATYLHTLHRSVIGSFFLIQDPHHVENIRKVVKQRTYFLDTNTYLAWFYPSQSPHGIVKPLFDLMRSYGVKICILPDTVEEIKRIEIDAHRALLRAEHDSGWATYLSRNRKAISADYLHARTADKNLTLPIWEKLTVGVDRILLANGIDVVPIDIVSNGFNRDLDTFRNAVKGCKQDAGRFINDEAIEHDALALLSLSAIQLKGSRDEWGPRERFITLDSTLTAAIKELRNALGRRYDFPDSPYTVARLLIPTAARELPRESYEDYVVNAIQQDLGVLTEMRGYSDVYLIDKLDKAGLPVRTLLDAPAHMIEPVLAELQGRHGLGRRLDQVIATTDLAERSVLAEGLNREIAEAIAFKSELQADTEAQLLQERQNRLKQELEVAALRHEVSRISGMVAQTTGELEIVKEEERKATSKTRIYLVLVVLLLLITALLLVRR